MRNFIDIIDIPAEHLRSMVNEAKAMKAARKMPPSEGVTPAQPLAGAQLAMIFEKNSTRTRASFEAGIQQLGGSALILDKSTSQMSRGEPPRDTARVLSRYADMIMARLLSHDDLLEIVKYASVPVINGLTDVSHPCQALADVMTYEEHKGTIAGAKIAWFGDANNVLRSLMHAAERFNFQLYASVPTEIFERKGFAEEAEQYKNVFHSPDPMDAAFEADALFTDVWTSMGDDIDPEYAKKIFTPYQINRELVAEAKRSAILLHCLPANRGEEITDEMLESGASVVFDEAENRLHVQKSVMLWCLRRGHSFV